MVFAVVDRHNDCLDTLWLFDCLWPLCYHGVLASVFARDLLPFLTYIWLSNRAWTIVCWRPSRLYKTANENEETATVGDTSNGSQVSLDIMTDIRCTDTIQFIKQPSFLQFLITLQASGQVTEFWHTSRYSLDCYRYRTMTMTTPMTDEIRMRIGAVQSTCLSLKRVFLDSAVETISKSRTDNIWECIIYSRSSGTTCPRTRSHSPL